MLKSSHDAEFFEYFEANGLKILSVLQDCMLANTASKYQFYIIKCVLPWQASLDYVPTYQPPYHGTRSKYTAIDKEN